MKILHTSDWHIGHTLYTKKRLEEHRRFLEWLGTLIEEREIGALIISGDVFDTGAPGGAAQALYYDFLTSVMDTGCSTVVITSGNHDSPRMLEAPAGLLKSLHIHVVGLPRNPQDHVIALHGSDGEVHALCCGVPYLRKNEMVRIDDNGVTGDGKIAAAVRAFYRSVTDAAVAKRKALGTDVPIVATGHLFAAGAQTMGGDGVRDLYVGSLGQVGADVFPDEIGYVALGHIHGHQTVAGKKHIRYSGSPLPMSFSEIGRDKCVIEIDTDGMGIEVIDVPIFQKLVRISGDYAEIMDELEKIADEDVWAEVTYTGEEAQASLTYDISEAVKGRRAEVLGIRNNQMMRRILKAEDTEQTLETMSVQDVFLKCLDTQTLGEKARGEMIACFNEIAAEVEERDACE